MAYKVSRTMSTQHPDNVKSPFFADNSIIGGEDEIKEAFYVFSHLKGREQLWDFEGKEVDRFVVKKLLTRYAPFFSKNRLGKDFYLTLRVPNPIVEKSESKVLIETLHSIPRSYDTANAIYEDNITPIFEVAVPMVTDAKQVIRIKQFYEKYVVDVQNHHLMHNDISISEWIGSFKPESVNIIPLLEDKDSIINSDKIMKEYIEHEKIEEMQRVWFARSDPALNYGSLSNTLIIKIAVQKMQKLSEQISVDLLPILGCGSAPFRGNFRPDNVKEMLEGYPSIQTFTVQSAFKYDYPADDVREAISVLNDSKRGRPVPVDEAKLNLIISKLSEAYQKQLPLLADFINEFSKNIPQRRKRVLHIGLFGYSRGVNGVKLPRAIPLCCSLYSAGIPPDILGLNALDEKDIDYIKDIYSSFEPDLKQAMQYYNKENLKYFPDEIQKLFSDVEKKFPEIFSNPDSAHKKVSSIIMQDFKNKNSHALSENIARAGELRGFLG